LRSKCYRKSGCRRYGTIFTVTQALLVSLTSAVEAEVPPYYLNVAEVKLLADSSDANNWAEYGWALWRLGEVKADWAFSRALHENSECHEANRGLAAVASAQGEFDSALENLRFCETSDTLAVIMKISILQRTGNLPEADTLLGSIACTDSSSFSGTFRLLGARQARLSGDPLLAAQLLSSALSDTDTSGFQQITRLERTLFHGAEHAMNSDEIIEALRFDITYLGSVYTDTALSYLDSMSPRDPLLPARIVQATGDYETAYKLLPEQMPVTRCAEDRLWVTELLIRLDRYVEAMDHVDLALLQDSTDAGAWRLKGILLLRSHLYFEAFEAMKTALSATGNAFECQALAGLAAEMAGESKLSVESYAPLLASSSDSVVLINRLRQLVWGENLNYNFDYEDRDSFSNTSRSWLNGRISFSYSASSGEVEQSRLGMNADVQHLYGLYGSDISASASYSFQKWPGESGKQENSLASISAIHRTTSKYYGTVDISWERRRYDISRWNLEMSTGIGRLFRPITPLTINVEAGVGGVINRWDVETGYEADWVALATLYSAIDGQMFSNYLPVLSAYIYFTQQLNDISRYDINSGLQLEYYASRLVSFSVGHDITYLSAIPPEYNDIFNANTYFQLGFRF